MSEEGVLGLEIRKEALQPQLREVIERLPPETPEDFKRRAIVAAQFITELDEGELEENEARLRFREQLASTGFIKSVYLHHRMPFLFSGAPEPREALPSWLFNEEEDHNNVGESGVIEAAFQQWVERKGFESTHEPNGTYYTLGSRDPQALKTRTFKGYIEEGLLAKGLSSGELPQTIDELQLQSLGPESMKLFEGERLVLYFGQDVGASERIREVFRKNGFEFRGPAQDVWEVVVGEDLGLELKLTTSNDGSLGDGGHTPVQYQLKQYNAAEFFDNYLHLCFWAGKAPDEPYKTSFTWLIDREGRAGNNSQLAKEAQEVAGYPVFYAKNKLNNIDRKWIQ